MSAGAGGAGNEALGTFRPGTLSALLQEIAAAPAPAAGAWESGLHPGAAVGRFELVRELGRGGFGVVWEAKDHELGRRVALKAVRAVGRRDLREERLLREAEAAAQLAHPNIVTLHDVGRTEGGPYLVLELLDGKTLAERLGVGAVPPREAVHVAVEIAKGLAHAHAHGVVHRDLKPENVFLCRDGQVKVLDFGLSHAFGRRRADGGTPAYMAPEQATGAPEDERTDVFALGAMLFEMLSGKRPFEDRKALESARPAPRLEVAAAPGLGELVARMLAKEPVERPRDGEEALAALAAVERELERAPAPSAGPVRTRRRPGRGRAVLVAAGVAAVAAFAVVAWWRFRAAPPRSDARTAAASAAPPAASIAVLPFADLSPGKDQEYFADGVAEEILNALSHVGGLHVAGRTSSFSFRGKTVQIQEIGRQLNVRAVLEGSLRREGSRVRITAQVVDVADGYHLWSETYSRELTGIFAVQDDIAREVVEALKVKLVPGKGPGGAEGRTADPESHNYYLMGLHHGALRTLEGARRSRAALEKALSLDPGNAPAQAALAMAIFGLYEFSTGTTPADDDLRRQALAADDDLRRQAMAAAEKAVAMAPGLAEGHRVRGFLRLTLFDWAGGRADLERALSLRPNDPPTLAHSGLLLGAFGRLTEGIALAKRAADLDPLSGPAWAWLPRLYMGSGHLPSAQAALDRLLEIVPDGPYAWQSQIELYLLQGRPEAALSAAQRLADPSDAVSAASGIRLLGVALAEHDLGHAAESDRALEKLISRWGHGLQYHIGQAHAWRGDADRAFEWLERAWRERDPATTFIKFDPLLRRIRGDPRYPALLEKMNLPVD